MNARAEIVPSLVERIKQTMVGLKMPRAIESLDATLRRLERGEMTALEAIDALLTEEFTLRETRRVKTALVMARLSTIKTLAGFDFSFQPSLDKNRIMALAELRAGGGTGALWASISDPRKQEWIMNWDEIEGNWKQLKGKVRVGDAMPTHRRVCIPNRSTKSADRRREQKKRWFRNGQKWRTGCEGRISVVKRRHGLDRCRYKGFVGMERLA